MSDQSAERKQQAALSRRAVLWVLGVIGAAISAVVVAWMARWLGPAPVEQPENTIVHMTLSDSDRRSLEAEVTRAASLSRAGGSGAKDEMEARIKLLTGWAIDKTRESGKPGLIYLFDLPSGWIRRQHAACWRQRFASL